uniref:Uncharacterized protein n=1 Tax=Parascaris univalens TaxID=6257 RepID=A0A915BVL3_PARUN
SLPLVARPGAALSWCCVLPSPLLVLLLAPGAAPAPGVLPRSLCCRSALLLLPGAAPATWCCSRSWLLCSCDCSCWLLLICCGHCCTFGQTSPLAGH